MTMEARCLIKSCTVCGNRSEIWCQRCRAPYCGFKCRESDWPYHKSLCVPMPSLVSVDYFEIKRPQRPLLHDIATARPGPSQISPVRKTMAAKDFPINCEPLLQNNPNVPLKTDEKSKASLIKNATKSADASFRNPGSLVLYTHNDQFTDGRTVVPTNVKNSEQPKPLISEVGTKQVNVTFKIDDSTSNSPKIRPTAIPKAAEMEEAPKPLKVEAPQKPLNMEAPPKQVICSASSKLAEAWKTPIPIEKTGFVSVIVQFTAKDSSQTVWVMTDENEGISVALLCEINKNISAAPNVKREDVKVNQLYRVKFEGIYYRGVVLEPVTSDGLVLVRLIDHGNELNVSMDSLKTGIPSMNKLHALSFPIKFKAPRKVAFGDELQIQVKSIGNGNIINVLVEGEVAFPTKDDLKIVPIPVGTKTKLYCLDYSNINEGYIAACVYDIKTFNRVAGIGAKISEFCALYKDGYTPQLNELCLVLCEDGEWYRAIIEKIIDSNTFAVMFVDYCNKIVIKSSNIRKMPDQFMHQCLLNKCFIIGAPEKLTISDIKKMVSYFSKNQIFTIESATKVNAGYMINVAELQW